MAKKIYQLTLDTEFDKDILDRMEQVPPRRKAEWVRDAIRFYMNNGEGQVILQPYAPVAPQVEREEKKEELVGEEPRDLEF